MNIETGDLVKLKDNLQWFSVEKIDHNKRQFQAGYNPNTLEWDGKWYSFNDIKDKSSKNEQRKLMGM